MEEPPKRRGFGERCCLSFSSSLRQFLLLLAKNFLLQVRRPVGTFFEIILPLLAVVFLVGFRLGLNSLQATDQCFVTFDSDPLVIPNVFTPYYVYYSPNTQNNTQELASIISTLLAPSGGILIGAATQNEMVEMINNNVSSQTQPCYSMGGVGIYFDEITATDIVYTLRFPRSEIDEWFTDSTTSNFQLIGARVTPNPYFSEGFMQLEKIVNEAIVNFTTGSPLPVDVHARQFPYPPYRRDLFLQLVSAILPLFLILSLIYSAGSFVKELVLEKETRIRETMKMMGLSSWILWTTWFLKQMLFYLPVLILMSILLKYGRIFPESNWFLLFVFLLVYFMSGVAFCFLISAWFSSARIGLFAGFIIWFVFYFPYFFIGGLYDTFNLPTKVCLCFISNTCIGLATNVLSALELRQEGLQFDNLARAISLDDPFNMGYVILMLVIDTLLYMVLYWYIDAVKPGTYGIPKPFYFPFLPSYWCPRRKQRPLKADELEALSNYDYNAQSHEREPTDRPLGIAIDNLTKIYNRRNLKRRKLAVDNLSLKMYKGQITALLGHNGAGKTTTLSILTGLFPPTQGTAYINRLSVVDDIDLIRTNLGICPQHNVLFDRLTVNEHLIFFSLLKGCPRSKVMPEVRTMVEDLLLVDKKSIQAQKLSGGMKRKLSVGIALVGGSEVVILDEPTSGMDPYARRATWDLLIKHKEGRTILLTTHFMDEADLLGDRIAIMSQGQLRCSGSSLFLKSRYGVGYHLTIVKEPKCNSEGLISLVTGTVTGSELGTDVGAELSFVLPSTSSHLFPQLFDTLNDRKVDLGVSSFGISVTTMEEVFIRVASDTEHVLLQESRLEKQTSVQASTDPTSSLQYANAAAAEASFNEEEGDVEVQEAIVTFKGGEEEEEKEKEEEVKENDKVVEQSKDTELEEFCIGNQEELKHLNSGIILWFQQFCAIFLKRVYHSIRFWAAIIWQLIIPLLFVLWGLIVAKTVPGITSEPPRRLISIMNSAPSNNITFFWASFVPGANLFQNESSMDALGVTNFFDYTQQVLSIRNNVQNYTQGDQCCAYRRQFLDKFCLTRNLDDLRGSGRSAAVCPDSNDFGYQNCLNCLGCCNSKLGRASTCTNSFLVADNSQLSCPTPAAVSITDQSTSGPSPQGPVDDINVFVAENILNISDSFHVFDFFLRFQGGYVLHSPYPTYSTCGCTNDPSSSCPSLAYSLAPNASNININSNISINIGSLIQSFNISAICSIAANNGRDFSDCDMDEESDEWSYHYNVITDTCAGSTDCLGVDNRCTCSGARAPDTACQLGRTSQPIPSNIRATVTVWYNNQPYHMAAAALTGFYNVYLKDRGVTISVYNDPLPRRLEDQVTSSGEVFGFIISVLSIFGLSFLFASFIIILVQERDSKAKHLQFVSGVNASSYWLATFAWDLINAFIPCIIVVILFAAFQIEGFKGTNIAAIFLLVIFSCWASIPLNYIMSFLFVNGLVAFCVMLLFFFFVSLAFQVSVFFVTNVNTQRTMNYIFLLHPAYALVGGLNLMYDNQITQNGCEQSEQARMICAARNVEYTTNIFDFSPPGIGHIFIYMTLEGIVFMALTILIERKFYVPELRQLICRHKKVGALDEAAIAAFPEEDDDVSEERSKVNGMTQFTSSQAVVIKNLVKEYKDIGATLFPYLSQCDGRKLAVNGVNLIIPAGECFGLLGVNGAGKTTTFKILTGDLTSSSGTAILSGYDINTQLRLVQQRIGYCPQFDALIERLTGRELLTMFARLRGIPERAIKAAVQKELSRLDLEKYADKRSGTYSGGNKRKLSTAIALVGNPPILLLDEPTTGMDPATRRFLWDVLIGVIKEGRSVILTSHSMEECEALCTRIAIMVNGSFKCLGSIQHLKSKFGHGYTLQLRVQPSAVTSPPPLERANSSRRSFRGSQSGPTSPRRTTQGFDTTEIQQFIVSKFPGSILLEQHQGSVTYQVPGTGVSESVLFRTIEENMERFNIINYSVSQTTLDQVFINFAQEQDAEEARL